MFPELSDPARDQTVVAILSTIYRQTVRRILQETHRGALFWFWRPLKHQIDAEKTVAAVEILWAIIGILFFLRLGWYEKVANNITFNAQNALAILPKEHLWWLILRRIVTVKFKNLLLFEPPRRLDSREILTLSVFFFSLSFVSFCSLSGIGSSKSFSKYNATALLVWSDAIDNRQQCVTF